MDMKNTRMKVINEVFNNIKLIKMNAWEKFFMKKLQKKRDLEVAAQKMKVKSRVMLLFFMWLTPNTIVATVFFLYIRFGSELLKPVVAFTVVAIF
jgi:hypothetical protein